VEECGNTEFYCSTAMTCVPMHSDALRAACRRVPWQIPDSLRAKARIEWE